MPAVGGAGGGVLLVKTPVYNTGTLTGTGNTCSDADTDLRVILDAAATSNCMTIYGPNADVYWSSYVVTVNSCQPNGVGKKETGSASYQCISCSV